MKVVLILESCAHVDSRMRGRCSRRREEKVGHRSGVGDKHWEVPRETDGWCREKPWSPDQARTEERSLEKSCESGILAKLYH